MVDSRRVRGDRLKICSPSGFASSNLAPGKFFLVINLIVFSSYSFNENKELEYERLYHIIIKFNRIHHHCKLMPTISVNVPEKMKEKIDELSKENMYSNTSEYIRNALRKEIQNDNGLTPEEEEIVLKRLKQIEEREDRGRTLEEVSEELGIE